MNATDETISTTIKVLATARDIRREDIAAGVGMPRSTFFRHMRLGGWSADAVQRIADYLGVDVSQLYRGLDLLPRQESNLQPADYRFAA